MKLAKSRLKKIILEELAIILERQPIKTDLKTQFHIAVYTLDDKEFVGEIARAAKLYDNFSPAEIDYDEPKKEPKKKVNIAIAETAVEKKENAKDKKNVRFYIYKCTDKAPYTCSEPISEKIKSRKNVKSFYKKLIAALKSYEARP
jgi:hypothetical protein